MRLCQATQQWRPEGASLYAHLGAKWLCDWNQSRRWKSGAAPTLIISLLLGAMGLTLQFYKAPISENFLDALTWAAGGLLIVLYLPLLLSTVAMSRKKILRRLFSPELWVAITIASCLVLGWPWQLGPLLSLVGLAVFFIFLRVGEAWFWKRRLASTHYREEIFWVESLDSWELKTSLSLGLMGLVLVSAVVAIDFFDTGVFLAHPWTLLAMVPFCIPTSQWLVTRLSQRSEEEGWIVRTFKFFQSLRQKKLGILHASGVLSSGDFKVTDLWIDSGTDWSQDDIRDICLQLTAGRVHPTAIALQKHFSAPKRFLFDLEDMEVLPHLGVKASFKDPQRARVKVVIGTISWHRSLQSEMADEGRQTIRNWVDAGSHISLLAINQIVVAAFRFEDNWREDAVQAIDQLQSLNLFTTSLSSSCKPILRAATNESKWDLFPVERKLQLKIWTEREPNAFEVKSFWDPASPIKVPVMCMRPLEFQPLDDEAMTLTSNKLTAVPAAIRSSKSFHGSAWALRVLSVVAGLFCLGLPSPWLIIGIIFALYTGSLIWLAKFALK